MNKTRAKVHPGVRMFGNAMAGIAGHHKSKPVVLKEESTELEVTQAECSRQIKISEEFVPVFPQSPSTLLESKTHLLQDIDDHYQETPDNPSDDYSLPLTQSLPSGFNASPLNPQFYSPLSPFSYNTETSTYYSPIQPQWSYFSPLLQCPKPSDVYAFNMSEMYADAGESEQAPVEALEESFDYSLPVMLPESSQDSGCLSSEDGSSSETSLKEIPCSLSYYHTVNASEEPSHPQENASSPVPSQPKEDPVISGRVSRRSVPRVQGPTTSFSTGTRTIKCIPIPRKSLPVPSPQYINTSVSDDSGTEISTDEDPSPLRSGCRSCEKESEMLFEADAQKRWRPLPDYSRLDFLTCKSSPGFIDSHCHLDFLFQRQNYDGTYGDYMLKHRDTYPASYEGCVAVFCNPHTFHRKTMWQRYLKENGVWAAFGCHPHNANAYSDLMEKDLCEALLHSKVQALGEIGLDYSNRNDCSKERQQFVFRRQLQIALAKKLPLVIHCRDANEDIMRIMKEVLPRNHLIHLHCFTDGWDWAQKWLSEFPNLFIGITNLVTYNSAQPTHEVAKRIPLDRLLLETDTPYFIPRMSPRTTKFSHPGMAIHVAAQIATLRSLPLKEVIHRTRQNTKTVYGI